MGRHLFRVEPEAHGESLLAADDDGGDAANGLEAALDLHFRQRRQLEGRIAFAVHADPDHGHGVGILLGDDRFVDAVGQASAHPGNAVAHILRRQIDVARQIELDGDVADLLATLARQGFDPFDVVDRLFETFGHFRFDHRGIRSRINRGDADNRRVDVRQFAHGQAGEADDPKKDQRQIHHRGEDRPFDADAGNRHAGLRFGRGTIGRRGARLIGRGNLNGRTGAALLDPFRYDHFAIL